MPHGRKEMSLKKLGVLFDAYINVACGGVIHIFFAFHVEQDIGVGAALRLQEGGQSGQVIDVGVHVIDAENVDLRGNGTAQGGQKRNERSFHRRKVSRVRVNRKICYNEGAMEMLSGMGFSFRNSVASSFPCF